MTESQSRSPLPEQRYEKDRTDLFFRSASESREKGFEQSHNEHPAYTHACTQPHDVQPSRSLKRHGTKCPGREGNHLKAVNIQGKPGFLDDLTRFQVEYGVALQRHANQFRVPLHRIRRHRSDPWSERKGVVAVSLTMSRVGSGPSCLSVSLQGDMRIGTRQESR